MLASPSAARFSADEHAWQAATRTEAPAIAPSPGCDAGDAALEAVALRLAHREALGLELPAGAELAFALRAQGSPHVWPRGWTLSNAESQADASERLTRFITNIPVEGRRTCGIAGTQTRSGKDVRAAVVVDVLAELEPIPTRVRAGQWIDVRARLLVPATDASVIVLGPSGRPRTVPRSYRARRLAARFSADLPGLWLIQIVANVELGPRPVLEAIVGADRDPPASYVAEAAPGEESLAASTTDADALLTLVSVARGDEGLPPLRRDPRLEAVARAHAENMRVRKQLSHDVGDGGPEQRLARAGLEGAIAGENVAHARDARRAHRALWASPSHRGNMLDRRFNSIGIGWVADDDGSIWVCELFANLGGASPGEP